MEMRMTAEECHTCHQARLVINPKWLRELRERAGIGLNEFARRTGLSAPYLSDVERGNRACSARVLAKYEELVQR